MTGQSWFWDILRRIFASLDGIVYGLIQTLYQLFAYIAKLSVFDENSFGQLQTRIYVVLGIVMLFKITFSLISLLSNPDDISDSKKGIAGIVQRIIISLILITFVSTIFKTARSIQNIILDDNIIGQFFLGDLGAEVTDSTQGAGNLVAFQVLSAFYYPEPKLSVNENGTDCTSEDPNKKVKWIEVDKDGTGGITRNATVLKKDMPFCTASLSGPEGFYYVTHHSYDIDEYLGLYVNEEAGKDGNGAGTGYYAMHYNWLISTIAGVVVAWLFLGYCIDVAIRSVKLGVLQLIAPIPIFSYIDPKKGESIFQNWVKTTVSTYLGLFGRLALIYFVLYICNILMTSTFSISDETGALVAQEIGNDDAVMANFARAFIYIGLLLFAKDAPKLFSDMFGIKMEGSFGTKLAKMGMVGTALGAGMLGSKFVGGNWRRHLEKKNLRSDRDKIDAKMKAEGRESYTDEEEKKIQEINQKLGMGYGAMQVSRGMRVGALQGMLAGKGGKLDLATYRQTRTSANQIQKRRENGVSFIKDTQEKIHQNLGMGGKYGQFGEWSDKAKELKNQISEGEKQEKAYFERYTNEGLNFMKQYGISAEAMESYDNAIQSGEEKNIREAQTLLAQRQAKALAAKYGDISKLDNNSQEYINYQNDVSQFTKDMKIINDYYSMGKKKSEANQELKKTLGKIEDNMQKGDKK